MILAGDIGATKVHLALYYRAGRELTLERDARFFAKDYVALEDVVGRFLGSDEVTAACFGVPGPVNQGRSRMANLTWLVDSRRVAAALGIGRVCLLNDLEATSYGIAKLRPDQLLTLNEGRRRATGARALIAAGTGLGETFLTWGGSGYVSHPSEGGHTDFAPRNDDEADLLRYLMRKYGGRVSVERVVSGPGLSNIYAFLRDFRAMEEPAWLADEIAEADDPNTIISCNALSGKNALCERTLDMFMSAYGAEAGNLGLTTLSAGGLYIGGGIAPNVLEKFEDGTFWRAFVDKGRLSRLLIEMPVHVILDSHAALLGVATYAAAKFDPPEATCGKP